MQPVTIENVAGQRMLQLTRPQAIHLRFFPFWTTVSENAKALLAVLALCVLMMPYGIDSYKLSMAVAHFNRGLELYYQGRNEEAIRQYQQSLRIRPGYSGSYDNIGLCLEEEGHRAQAISMYRQALVLDPNNSHAYSNLDAALFVQGHRAAGLVELRAAVRANPNDGRSHTMLGSALYRSGDKWQARQEWQKALGLGDQSAAHDLQKFGGNY